MKIQYLKEFTLFPELPIEIRDMIWAFAILQTPRLVKTQIKWDVNPSSDVIPGLRTE